MQPTLSLSNGTTARGGPRPPSNATNSVYKFVDHTYIYYSTAATYFRLSGRHQVDRLNYYRHVLQIFTFFF